MKTHLVTWTKHGHPHEDAHCIDHTHDIYLVADGVTRTPGPTGYPDPSPAAIAAKNVIGEAHAYLAQITDKTTQAWRLAASHGNRAVADYNRQQLGITSETTDYWMNDLAGALLAGLALHDAHFSWGFMTDCGIAQLRKRELVFITPDRLRPIRDRCFSKIRATDQRERQIIIRRDYRNKPSQGTDKSYGVLTGESTAVRYFETGQQRFEIGDTLLVFTDGIRPLIEDVAYRQTLTEGSDSVLSEDLTSTSYYEKDDATLIIIRT